MNLATLIQLFRTLARDGFKHRNEPGRWEGWIDLHGDKDEPQKIELKGKYKSVSVELTGLKFELDLDGEAVVLEARSDLSDLHRLFVYVDGALDPEARLANPTLKPTGAHPLRTALDFRPVTFRGHETRFNLRFNG